jgi:hypothetical protein
VIDFDAMKKEIEQLRSKYLFHEDGDEGAAHDCNAEQYLLLSLGALEQAERFAQLAAYAEARAMGAARGMR